MYILSHGSGKVWHWIIKNDDINIQVGNGDYRGIIAHARIASQYLWGVGALHYVLDSIQKCLNKLFRHVMYLTPSEIDSCADVANWPTSELDRSRFITKARKGKVEFDEESLMVGAKRVEFSGPKQDTIYIGKRKSPVLYALIRQEGLPVHRFGRRVLVDPNELKNWLVLRRERAS